VGHYLSEIEGDPYGWKAEQKRKDKLRADIDEKLKPLGLSVYELATVFQTKI